MREGCGDNSDRGRTIADGSPLLRRPPVTEEDAVRLAALSSIPATVIDHYAHARLLQRAWQLRRENNQELIPVFIEVQSLTKGPGIRPGHDLHDLARGCQQLPGLTVAGLLMDLRIAGDQTPSGLASHLERLHDQWRQLAPARSSCEEAGMNYSSPCVVLGNPSARPEIEAIIEQLAAGDLFRVIGHVRRTNANVPAEECRVAHVLGRPELSRAVLEAGTDDLGSLPSGWRLPRGHSRCLVATEERSLWELVGDDQQLRIGDTVHVLAVETPRD